MLSEVEFTRSASEMLARIEQLLLDVDADIDVEMPADGVLEVEFPDRSKMVLNRHQAAREIWVAAKSGGFHFRWDGQREAWVDTKSGDALLPVLSRLVSTQIARPVTLG